MLQSGPVGLAGEELTVSTFVYCVLFVLCNIQMMPFLVGYLLRLLLLIPSIISIPNAPL